MIKIEKTDVYGFEAAIRGMRNAYESHDKSDSYWTYIENPETLNTAKFQYFVGENDLELMKSLSKAGNDHAKYQRMINVTLDVTAPFYWWKEYSTFKVGTVANSTSTMHSIHKKEFTLDDFSHEHLTHYSHDGELCRSWIDDLEELIDDLNLAREKYLESKDKLYWWQMIQLLPTSYNQKRTLQLNYQVLKNIYHSRKNHKLDEWHTFCDWIETLPYFKEVCIND